MLSVCTNAILDLYIYLVFAPMPFLIYICLQYLLQCPPWSVCMLIVFAAMPSVICKCLVFAAMPSLICICLQYLQPCHPWSVYACNVCSKAIPDLYMLTMFAARPSLICKWVGLSFGWDSGSLSDGWWGCGEGWGGKQPVSLYAEQSLAFLHQEGPTEYFIVSPA